jgi:hypothetical protein
MASGKIGLAEKDLGVKVEPREALFAIFIASTNICVLHYSGNARHQIAEIYPCDLWWDQTCVFGDMEVRLVFDQVIVRTKKP